MALVLPVQNYAPRRVVMIQMEQERRGEISDLWRGPRELRRCDEERRGRRGDSKFCVVGRGENRRILAGRGPHPDPEMDPLFTRRNRSSQNLRF
ncbi:hypothetical protein CTAM01_14641 [Colletotrichum tamarilloi]|uniref:Uncharacterized protein n=1 Tax=Colletotrichum tamarilloi TaxID=1209934 RepID=A0ABQ9QNM8_9PEZI|nr:uncharacterized protein CTAM01_14641 [Colletotrichum tamarilloi]KAK1479648.1 hypothetical protein CTAM01_14641 [Colletotrichum tamarilloi]